MEQDHENRLSQIALLLKETHAVRPDRVRPGTRLSADLGMDGDDAVEFIEAFFVRFGVDRGMFRYDDHFGPEAPLSPWSVLLFIGPRTRDVRVSQLMEAIGRGRWDSTVEGLV